MLLYLRWRTGLKVRGPRASEGAHAGHFACCAGSFYGLGAFLEDVSEVSAYVRSDDQEPSALQQGMAHLPKPEKASYELAVDQALAKAFNIKKANLQWLNQLVTDLKARKVCLKEDEVPEDPTKTEA